MKFKKYINFATSIKPQNPKTPKPHNIVIYDKAVKKMYEFHLN